MFESLRTQSQLVLTDFGLPEFCDAIEVEKLAYEVWLAMAMLRSLGKGAELVVSPEIGGVGTRKSDELQFLVDHYDARQTAMHTTATGTTFEDTVQGKNNGLVPLPQYNVQQTPFASFDPIFRRLGCSLEGPPGQVSTTNFIWIPFDLRAYYHAHKPFSAAFKEKHGVSLESVVAIIGTILRNAAFEMVTDYPRRFIRLWQRAYQPPCPIENYRQRIYNGLPTVLSHLELPLRPEEVDVDGAMAFLTLTDARRGDIDIGYGGPHCIFLPAGEGKIIIDYAYIYLRLYYLFHRVSIPDQNFKGDALENVTRRGGSVLPTRALKAPDGTERQIDAAFAIEDTLVICECRAVAKSIAVFRGEPQALEKRIRVIETALSDVDEKAHWLASHPQGSNYDVTQYRLIMPVAVTPFLEFIPSRSSRYWIDERLPRVLTPAELQEALTDGSIRTAAPHCPNSVRLR